MSNREQIEYWNGRAGDRWTAHQESISRTLESFGRAGIERLQLGAGQRVLDVGCGCGDTTLELAACVGDSGFVCGVDLSAQMIERAKERCSGLSQVELKKADAAEHDFGLEFDAVFSRFGVMFFADPTSAFRNLRRVLSPQGHLAFVCWCGVEANPWCSVVLDAVRDILGDQTPDVSGDGPGPFAFADEDRVRRILDVAGFSAVELRPFDDDFVFSVSGLGDAVAFSMGVGPAAAALADASVDAERARAALCEALLPWLSGDRVALPGRAWIVHADSSART
jgi:SAM-dependent methyltransferase